MTAYKFLVKSIILLVIMFLFQACQDNSQQAEIKKLELQLELEKIKQNNRLDAKLNAEEERRKVEQAKLNAERQNSKSSVKVVLDEIDDIAFVGFPSNEQINLNLPLSITTKYDRGSYSNGSQTAYIEDDVPLGVSYMCVGVYNWVWTGFGKGKYQYNLKVEIDDNLILRESTGGRINDNTEGMKFFRVLKLEKSRSGSITVSSNVSNSTSSQLKRRYSSMMRMKNPN